MISKIKSFFSISEDEKNNRTILWICCMHFCWGMASSMIFSLLPVFIVDELKGTNKAFGALEGAVVFLSFMAKLFAGFIMDIFKRKLPMLRVGTVLTVFSKLALACAPNVFFVFISKSIDRFAKGLRQAPSDTMLGELSTKKGLAYSLRYTMNISGFLTGSIITSTIIAKLGNEFRLVFSLAVIPAIVAMYILSFKIKYNDKEINKVKNKQKWKVSDVRFMPRVYWKFIIFISLLMFNRFSEGFITLKAKEIIPERIGDFPLFMGLYEISAVCMAFIIGRIADDIDKRKLMWFGVLLIIIADLFGIYAKSVSTILLIYIFSGLHMGCTQGLIGSMIARFAPKNLMGTAFALFYGVEGCVLLIANNIAGRTSTIANFVGLQSASGPFVLGACFSVLSFIFLSNWLKKEEFTSN